MYYVKFLIGIHCAKISESWRELELEGLIWILHQISVLVADFGHVSSDYQNAFLSIDCVNSVNKWIQSSHQRAQACEWSKQASIAKQAWRSAVPRSKWAEWAVRANGHSERPSGPLTRPDTRPIPVADGWAGAEMSVFALSQLDHHGPTNQPTDGRTDGQRLL